MRLIGRGSFDVAYEIERDVFGHRGTACKPVKITIERVSFIGLQDEESIDYLIAVSRYLEKTELTGERRA